MQNYEGMCFLFSDTHGVVDRLFDAWSKQLQWLPLPEITNL